MNALIQLPKPDLTREENDVLFAAEQILANRIVVGGDAMTDPSTVARYFQMRLGACDREVFSVMLLDAQHRIIAVQDLFFGTIDGAEVHPRIVAREALRSNAVAVILAHNHPSGNPEPSAADRAVTTRIKSALQLIEVRLLDHFVVVCGQAPTSLAMRGWI